nr:MAG TPA: hypothetical protein [Caudoviricetes sp.]
MATYDFKYTLTPTGSLSGLSMMQQTEDAINDLGTQNLINQQDVQAALKLAEQANTTADQGLSTANNALSLAQNNQQAIVTINSSITTLDNRIDDLNVELSGDISGVKETADTALEIAQQAVLFTVQDLSAEQQAQGRENLGAAPIESPTFTGTVTAGNVTITGTLDAVSDRAIADQLGNNIVDTYAPIYAPNFTGSATAVDLLVTGSLTGDLTGTADKAIADANGNNIAATYATKADTYTKAEVDSKLTSIYRYKGSVATYSALPSSGNVGGDVWNVEDSGKNYAWDDDNSTWDDLGGTVDLSGYLTVSDAQSTYLTISQASQTYLTQTSANSTFLTITTASSTYATKASLNGYLALTGGTLSGALILAADPTTAMGAATKQYVDAAITTGTTNAVLYVSQQLTTEQQTQARTNIGAISSVDIPADPTAHGIYEAFTEFNTENGIE